MMRSVQGGQVMAGDAASGGAGRPVLRTLADKVNWLIDKAHPGGRGPYSNNEVSFLIHKATGEQVSGTTIWKLRNGQATNPQMRLIEALAKTFGVPAAFFFDDYDERQLGLLQDQVELLALIRDANISAAEFRAILGLSPEGRKAVAGLIERAVRSEAQAPGRDKDEAPETG
jgi:transcriptional regulator with XRE-family HTH domain